MIKTVNEEGIGRKKTPMDFLENTWENRGKAKNSWAVTVVKCKDKIKDSSLRPIMKQNVEG